MNPSRRSWIVTLSTVAAAAAAFVAGPAQAQAWPTKPVTIVVAYPAGGDSDALARQYAEKLQARTGQPVIVDNKAGASGTLGTSFVVKAPADGHTLLLAPSTLVVAPLVLKLSPATAHDPAKDLTPIVMTGTIPLLLGTHPGGPKDLKQLVADAKAGKRVTYGSPGIGSPMHVVAEVLNQSAGVRIDHVPYRGIAPAVSDLMGGQITTAWGTPGAFAGQIAAGKIVPLAISDTKRTPFLPNVPTFAELGYKDVDIAAWHGLLGPKGLPANVVAVINGHMNEILKMPDVIEKMRVFGVGAVGGAPENLKKVIDADTTRFTKLVRDFKIEAE
jgi:tripartite-type tricarboxylate transporter receptor subunit TctC